MAHKQQLEFVRLLSELLPSYFNNATVLEIGSLDISGSIRNFYQRCNYTGIDLAPGKGVDVVCQGQDYNTADGSFDQVVSCEAMEHNPLWRETFANMIRLTREGGLVVMTCATYGRPEHGTSRTEPQSSPFTVEKGWDYYANLGKNDFLRAFNLNQSFSSFRFWSNWPHRDLYFVGIRNKADCETIATFNHATSIIQSWIEAQNHNVAYRLMSPAAALAGDAGVFLITKRNLYQFIWDLEKRYYQMAGFLRDFFNGRSSS